MFPYSSYRLDISNRNEFKMEIIAIYNKITHQNIFDLFTHLLQFCCAVLCNERMTEAIPIIIQRSWNIPLSMTPIYPLMTPTHVIYQLVK